MSAAESPLETISKETGVQGPAVFKSLECPLWVESGHSGFETECLL
jgi:hypothetical protein